MLAISIMAFNHCFVCPVGLYVAGSVFKQGVKLNRFFKANSGLTLKNGDKNGRNNVCVSHN